MANDKRLYRTVKAQIEQKIDTGEYPPGSRLPPERELAERLGVSRPTIREAMIALEALGRVEIKTGSGVYVCETPTLLHELEAHVSPFELTEARALIEGEAAALAATMITDDQLKELEAAMADMFNETVDGKLLSELADQRFHRLISEATRNSMMISVFNRLWFIRDNSPEVREACQIICKHDPESRVDEHQRILDALRRRDPNAAREAMHEHFASILEKLITADEQAKVEKIRRQVQESRKRFSLDHLKTAS